MQRELGDQLGSLLGTCLGPGQDGTTRHSHRREARSSHHISQTQACSPMVTDTPSFPSDSSMLSCPLPPRF